MWLGLRNLKTFHEFIKVVFVFISAEAIRVWIRAWSSTDFTDLILIPLLVNDVIPRLVAENSSLVLRRHRLDCTFHETELFNQADDVSFVRNFVATCLKKSFIFCLLAALD